MQTVNEITANDLVITKEGKNVMSGGFVNSNNFSIEYLNLLSSSTKKKKLCLPF